MTALTLRIDLLGPVLVTSLDGDPNGMVSYDYLPGSVLRGALIGAYMRAYDLSELDPANEATRRLFFDGHTRYLNAYPLPYGDARALPTPRSWFHEKGVDYPVYDLAAPEDERAALTQARRVATPFCSLAPADEDEEAEGVALLIRSERQVAVHIARARVGGVARTRDRDGTVFRYDALAGGQSFMAAIVVDHPDDARTLCALLDAPRDLTIGAARSAGYGRVRVHAVEDAAGWREAGEPAELARAPEREDLTVTLLSHTLLRDARGQYGVDPNLIGAAVAARLGLAEPLRPREDRVFTAGEVVGGFNRTWGLPLPQTLAARMGSVYVFARPDMSAVSDLPERLVRLEEQGIGERRAEGFGRLAVNWPAGTGWARMRPPKPRPEHFRFEGATDGAGADTARRMVERLLLRRLDALLVARANTLGNLITAAGPRPSQLARLRGIVQDALVMEPTAGRARLTAYLDTLSARQVTRRQFTADRVDGRPLLDWLRMRVGDEGDAAGVWDDLGITSRDLPAIGGVVPELNDKLAYRYNLRLVDGVLARAAKHIAHMREDDGHGG